MSKPRDGPSVPHLLALGVILLVGATFAEAFGPYFEALANFRLHLALLAGLVMGMALMARRRRAALLAALALVAALAGLGPVWSRPTRPAEGERVVILYANLRDANPHQAGLAEAIADTGADVVVTSETMPAAAEVLRRRFAHVLVARGTGPLRTAIWSRKPLGAARLQLDNTVGPTAAMARVELGHGCHLGVIGVHFSRAFEGIHMRQAAALGQMTQVLEHPLVVIGDFNAEPWTRVVRAAAKASATHIVGGWRRTWHGSYPTPLGPLPALLGHQIDQLLVSEGVGVQRIETVRLSGSDHDGLLVELRVP